jgi:hypothetical protein
MKKILILGILMVLSTASVPIAFSQDNPEAAADESSLGQSMVFNPAYDMDLYGDKPVYSMDRYGDKATNSLDRYGDKPVYSLGMRTAAKPVYDTSSLSSENPAFNVSQRRGTPARLNYTIGLVKPLYDVSAYYRFKPTYDVSSYFRAKPLYSVGTSPA